MNVKSLLWTAGKLLIVGLAFFVGSIAGSLLATRLGLPLPVMPEGFDSNKAGQSLPLVGVLMACVISIFAKQSGVGFVPRWLILGLFSWTAYSLTNYLEAKFFMPEMATTFALVMNLIACFACAAAAAWLFKPAAEVDEPFWARARAFCAARSTGDWTWRFLAALAAFPVAYFVFGWLVAPFVVAYYQQQYAGLALPTQGTMLVLALIRSLLFVLSILPLLMVWKSRRTHLFLALALALFMMVGGLNMLQAIWLPVSLRAPHLIEILADSTAHAAALVFLLVPAALAVPRKVVARSGLQSR